MSKEPSFEDLIREAEPICYEEAEKLLDALVRTWLPRTVRWLAEQADARPPSLDRPRKDVVPIGTWDEVEAACDALGALPNLSEWSDEEFSSGLAALASINPTWLFENTWSASRAHKKVCEALEYLTRARECRNLGTPDGRVASAALQAARSAEDYLAGAGLVGSLETRNVIRSARRLVARFLR